MIKKPFNAQEKAYILANHNKMTIRQMEAGLKQQDYCHLHSDLYIKIQGFLRRKNLSFKKEPSGIKTIGNLTPRQFEVLELMAQGLSNQEIADKLVLEISTIKAHVGDIYTKLFKEIIPDHALRVRAVLWYLENVKHISLRG